MNKTQNKESSAVRNWWVPLVQEVITGRKNLRLEEAMKINENSDTKIVGMHHTNGRIREFLKESWKIM